MKSNTIFVSIASYRDDVCNTTLLNLYEKAQFPNNIFVGICQQNKEGDPDCQGNLKNPNIRIIRLDYREAKGPTYARYMCSQLWDGEEYFLQIDSHSKFVQNWDTKLINMIKEIKEQGLSQKPVLSHYPKTIDEYETDSSVYSTPRICKPFFNTRDMISFMGSEVIDSKGKYYLTPFVAGGMMFCESYFLNELPFDPNLPYIFVGEEILHSIRFFTYGWDIFTCKENIVYHEYTRKDKPKIWTDNPYYSDMEAFNKIRFLLKLDKDDSKLTDNMKKDLDKYGLGNKRTLEEYYNLTGIDLEKRIVTKNFCRDNNVASKEDIEKSNEKNWTKEKFTERKINYYNAKMCCLCLIIIFIILYFLL